MPPDVSTARGTSDNTNEIDMNIFCVRQSVERGVDDKASDFHAPSELTWAPTRQVKSIVAGLASVIVVVGLDMTIFTVALPVWASSPIKNHLPNYHPP
jgi:hypothetical protein